VARTKAQREQERAEASVLRHRMQVELEAAKNAYVACPRHDWQVQLRPGQQPPPQSMCPQCVEERSGRRTTSTGKPTVRDLTGESEAMRAAYDRHLMLHPDQAPLAGTGAENDALEDMDAARDDALAREKAHRSGCRRDARLAYASRIEDGVLVGTYELPRRVRRAV
jgi:hypothetical protein